MTNCNPIPRSIRFNQNTLRNFVQGSSFLNSTSMLKQNKSATQPQQVNMAKTHSFEGKRQMGFQYFNRNNLLLRTCDLGDLQYVQKNVVVFQEDIAIKDNSKQVGVKAATSAGFYRAPVEKIQENQRSKQAEMNEFLFNYRKQEEEKKNKKLKFLEEIQDRINSLEQQTKQMQGQKVRQYEQLNQILQINTETTNFANQADLLGKINMAINQSSGYEVGQSSRSPKKLDEQMGLLQINAVLDEQHQCNDALFEEIQRASRSKGKQRVKASGSPKKSSSSNFNNQQSSMSKTLKRNPQVPPRPASASKKLTTTWKGKH